MATIEEAMALAIRHQRAGDLSYAEQVYRRIIEADPNHADAWCQLGTVCLVTGRAEAASHFRRAWSCAPIMPRPCASSREFRRRSPNHAKPRPAPPRPSRARLRRTLAIRLWIVGSWP